MNPRLIAAILVCDGWVVQSRGFRQFLPVGKIEIAVEFLDDWGVDEIVLLDIRATNAGRHIDPSLVDRASAKCTTPLCVGGGVNSLGCADQMFRNGADKIVLNSAAQDRPALISEIASVYGNQSIIVGIDVVWNEEAEAYVAVTGSATKTTGLSAVNAAKRAEERGAGEIFLNSVDRDGSQTGYDLRLVSQVVDAVTIPVIACGGAGHPRHFKDVIVEAGAGAAAAGNFFHFTEHSVMTVKSFLQANGVHVRSTDGNTYADRAFMSDGRISKLNEAGLAALRFIHHPKEVI